MNCLFRIGIVSTQKAHYITRKNILQRQLFRTLENNDDKKYLFDIEGAMKLNVPPKPYDSSNIAQLITRTPQEVHELLEATIKSEKTFLRYNNTYMY